MRADVFSTEKRAAVMRAVKSKNTAPERAVRAAACACGFRRRYRLNGAQLPGKPDLVFANLRKAVFVHGCFWHGHDCKRGARAPKDNAAYWRAKIARNQQRDAAALSALAGAGWSALVIWECETRDPGALQARLAAFLTPK
ncbi:MAG TPA: DNA mismatch endonuclease Vsr [Terricaulis sp.]|nr:DNA mismatch endonuclease Vsr [Terricaulis sp.]HRP09698.1 DNA mismatch endonuclease Vsr [Terricaulis sp.]